jgi:hypothetical protein
MLHRVAVIKTDVSKERSCSSRGQVSVVFLRSVRRLLVTAKDVPSSQIFVILMMEAIRSYDTLVLTTATRLNIPEDGILHVTVVKTSNLTYH